MSPLHPLAQTRHDQELKNEAAFIIQGFFKCVMAKKEAQRRRDEKEVQSGLSNGSFGKGGRRPTSAKPCGPLPLKSLHFECGECLDVPFAFSTTRV